MRGLLFSAVRTVGACATAPAKVSPSFVPSTPHAGRSIGSERSQELPVDVLNEEIEVRFDAGGLATKRVLLEYTVVDPQRLGPWGTVNVYFNTANQARPEVSVTVRRPDGAVVTMDPRDLEVGETPKEEMYDSFRALRGPIPGIVRGSTVRLEFILRDEQRLFAQDGFHRYTMGYLGDAHRARLLVEAPTTLPFHYTLLGDDRKPKTSAKAGLRSVEYLWPELDLPSSSPSLRPRSHLMGPEVHFSIAESWASVAKSYAAAVDQVLNAERVPAGPPIDPGAEREAIVSALVAWMNEGVRYIGVELGRGAFIPRTPAETVRNQFGDCKDQSLLLVALLRKHGIQADLALVRSGFNPRLSPLIPGLDAFNHAIVHIGGQDPLWVDPTASPLEVGALPASVQGASALLVRSDANALVDVPEVPSARNVYHERRIIRLKTLGAGEVEEITEATGTVGLSMRRRFLGSGTAEIRKSLAQYAESEYGGELIDHTPPDIRSAGPFSIRLVAEAPNEWSDGSRIEVSTYRALLSSWLPKPFLEELKKDEQYFLGRKHALYLGPATRVQLDLEIYPPSGFVLERPYPAVEEKGGPGRLVCRIEEKGGAVKVSFELDPGKSELSVEEGRALLEAIDRFDEALPSVVRFAHRGELLIRQGRLREGLDAYREALASKEPAALAVYASALVELGLAEAAREVVAPLQRSQPSDPLVWQQMAWIYTHDALGRQYAYGFPVAESEAAYRRALEIEKDINAEIGLASVLEHDLHGEIWANRERLEASRAILVANTDKSKDAEERLLVVDFFRGALKSLLKRVESQESPSSLAREVALAAAFATLEPTEAARRADEQGWWQDDDGSTPVAESAAPLLGMLDRYDAATALMKAALTRRPSSAWVRKVVQVYGQLAEGRAVKKEVSPAVRAAMQWMHLAMRGRFGTPAYRALIDPNAYEAILADEYARGLRDGIARRYVQLGGELDDSLVGIDADLGVSRVDLRPLCKASRAQVVQIQVRGARARYGVWVDLEASPPRVVGTTTKRGPWLRQIYAGLKRGQHEHADEWLECLAQDKGVALSARAFDLIIDAAELSSQRKRYFKLLARWFTSEPLHASLLPVARELRAWSRNRNQALHDLAGTLLRRRYLEDGALDKARTVELSDPRFAGSVELASLKALARDERWAELEESARALARPFDPKAKPSFFQLASASRAKALKAGLPWKGPSIAGMYLLEAALRLGHRKEADALATGLAPKTAASAWYIDWYRIRTDQAPVDHSAVNATSHDHRASDFREAVKAAAAGDHFRALEAVRRAHDSSHQRQLDYEERLPLAFMAARIGLAEHARWQLNEARKTMKPATLPFWLGDHLERRSLSP